MYTIILNGSFNLFPFSDGSLPSFDLVVLEQKLYFILGDERSTRWDEASSYGVKREDWEEYNKKIDEMVFNFNNSPSLAGSKLIFIYWNDAVNAITLAPMVV